MDNEFLLQVLSKIQKADLRWVEAIDGEVDNAWLIRERTLERGLKVLYNHHRTVEYVALHVEASYREFDFEKDEEIKRLEHIVSRITQIESFNEAIDISEFDSIYPGSVLEINPHPAGILLAAYLETPVGETPEKIELAKLKWKEIRYKIRRDLRPNIGKFLLQNYHQELSYHVLVDLTHDALWPRYIGDQLVHKMFSEKDQFGNPLVFYPAYCEYIESNLTKYLDNYAENLSEASDESPDGFPTPYGNKLAELIAAAAHLLVHHKAFGMTAEICQTIVNDFEKREYPQRLSVVALLSTAMGMAGKPTSEIDVFSRRIAHEAQSEREFYETPGYYNSEVNRELDAEFRDQEVNGISYFLDNEIKVD